MINSEIVKEFRILQEQVNDAIRRLDHLNAVQHTDNASQIADLQELVIDETYAETLNELGL